MVGTFAFLKEAVLKVLAITNTKTEGLLAQNLLRLIIRFLLVGVKPKILVLSQELTT